MPQVVRGILLGSPGGPGSPGIYLLYGEGEPYYSSDPNVQNCGLGSLYIDISAAGGGQMYINRSAAANAPAPAGWCIVAAVPVWTPEWVE